MESAARDETLTLLERSANGDREALDRLFVRYAPALTLWAHGRLPQWARDITETQDLVQDTLLQTFRNLDHFEYRGEGAFQAYLRQVLINRIRQQLRAGSRRPMHEALDSATEATDTTPLEAAIGHDVSERYEASLERLTSEERDLILARVELGLSHQEIAQAMGKPSADAARVAVARALVRLARAMEKEG